jgi:colanic acid/amylovoran biosynthesis glycosyltransferase
MRIALSSYCRYQDVGGVSSWLERLAAGLVARGHRVDILLRDSLRWGRRAEEDPGSILHRLPPLGVGLEVHIQGSLGQERAAVAAFLDRVRPDLFVPGEIESHFQAATAAAASGLPWVLALHNDHPGYWTLLERAAAQRPRPLVVSVSSLIHAKAKALWAGAGLHLVPYGVAIPAGMAQWQPDRFRVVYSGRLVEEQKRFRLVLNTLIESCRRSVRMEAQVLGGGPLQAWAEDRLAAAGMAERIRLCGPLTLQQVQAELLDAQALLLMSAYEGFGVVLIEAMAAGVVPLAAWQPGGVGGVGEVVHPGQTGLRLPAEVGPAAEGLVGLAGNPELWGRCSRAGRALVAQTYGMESFLDRWIAVLAEAVDPASATLPASGLSDG